MKNIIYALDSGLLNESDIFGRWYNTMPEYRRAKIDSFRFDKDKKLSLAAGILAYKALSEAGVDQSEVVFAEYSKPMVKDKEVYFNLSHSGDYAVCALSDKPVGVDIQKLRPFADNLVRFVYSPQEKQFVESFPEAERDREYTKLWTVKESIMKYLGTGISVGAKKITVDASGTMSASCVGYDLSHLHFTCFEIQDHFVTACSPYSCFVQDISWVTGEYLNG